MRRVTAYTLAHLMIAGLCAVMAAVHFGMWLAVRTEQAQLWVALSFVGFASLNAGIAGSSVAANGALGAPGGWILVSVATALPLALALLMTAWALLGCRVEGLRRTIVYVVSILAVTHMVHVGLVVVTEDLAVVTWESVRRETWVSSVPFLALSVIVAATWVVEAARALNQPKGLAWVLLLCAIPASLLIAREMAVTFTDSGGATYFGLTGLPFGLFASVVVAVRYVRLLRGSGATEGLAGYRRLYRLGRGGMGELWLASRAGEAGFHRYVALKRMRLPATISQQSERVERFLAEARMSAKLRQPNIVSVYDVGRFEAGWFIVMEYLAGPSVSDIAWRCFTRNTPVPVFVAAEIGEQICRGLEYAHSRGILHRDVTPDNVIVTLDGVVKLVDFGIAKERDQPASSPDDTPSPGQTRHGVIIGKTRYMSPERLTGMPATIETDVFSVGLILCELMLGELPERGAALSGDPHPIRKRRPDISDAFEAAIVRALDRDPSRRHKTAAAMGYQLASARRELDEVNLGAWTRKLFPERVDLEQRLANLVEPSRERVTELFDEVVGPGTPGTTEADEMPETVDRPS